MLRIWEVELFLCLCLERLYHYTQWLLSSHHFTLLRIYIIVIWYDDWSLSWLAPVHVSGHNGLLSSSDWGLVDHENGNEVQFVAVEHRRHTRGESMRGGNEAWIIQPSGSRSWQYCFLGLLTISRTCPRSQPCRHMIWSDMHLLLQSWIYAVSLQLHPVALSLDSLKCREWITCATGTWFVISIYHFPLFNNFTHPTMASISWLLILYRGYATF